MLFRILFFVLASSALFLQAQDIAPVVSNSIRVSYMGSVTYPGFKVGYEMPYKQTQVFKERRTVVKTFTKERSLNVNFGMYHHPTFHDNYFMQAEWNFRRQKGKGIFYEFSPGMGASRTFLTSATYEVDDRGNVSKVPLAGNYFALLSVSGSVGYNLSLMGNLPGKVFVKPGLLFLLPYSKLAYPRPTVELGYSWSLR
jgi:hypothetical protein